MMGAIDKLCVTKTSREIERLRERPSGKRYSEKEFQKIINEEETVAYTQRNGEK